MSSLIPSSERLQPWNLTQLKDALPADLAQCQTPSERINVQAFYRMDLKKSARHFRLARKLTPGECAILLSEGIDPDSL
jgi:hypothetical protein